MHYLLQWMLLCINEFSVPYLRFVFNFWVWCCRCNNEINCQEIICKKEIFNFRAIMKQIISCWNHHDGWRIFRKPANYRVLIFVNFSEGVELPPDFRGTILNTVMSMNTTTEEDWDFLWEKSVNSTSEAETSTMRYALGLIPNKDVLRKWVKRIHTNTRQALSSV